jgi:hypothetical protein
VEAAFRDRRHAADLEVIDRTDAKLRLRRPVGQRHYERHAEQRCRKRSECQEQ